MLLLDGHKQLMSDLAHQKEKISDFANLRKKSLHQRLGPVEALIRKYVQLPVTYDVGRLQQPYFSEYTYNDSLDAIYLTPQSAEVASIMAQKALDDEKYPRFDFETTFELSKNDHNNYDKYNLDPKTVTFSNKVVFPPGSNLFFKIVSKENLFRLMHEDQDVMIKPHPLSNTDLLRKLGRDFGYHRIMNPNTSGYVVLERAQQVWGTTASEMPIRAALLGKPVYNIGNFFEEQVGSHMPVNRLLWNQSGTEAQTRARRILGSPLSGFFFPDDPRLEENIQIYLRETLAVREHWKPLVYSMPDHLKLEMWKKEG